ncbi:coiled-coil domain-containing protein 93 [Oratosquilla oratoria]|uniref:coiled-coil domain-containing protein 93 n=1 Tax=Oratosquilla oratoria TaxID=337810 RepID=UPI003F777772
MITDDFKPRSNSAREGQVDIREDEEQSIKLTEIIELLVAAGYFRARIKGLSPFDKIIGGMTWCIETCNFDVDVDLLFHENLTIGQKIALTESIVCLLPIMQCPHHLEPHQIQGLDAIHIYPVIQWLVKKALETREEFGDETRAYALTEFKRQYQDPESATFQPWKKNAVSNLINTQSIYGPVRLWRRQGMRSNENESVAVQTTLLEYGQQFLLNKDAPVNEETFEDEADSKESSQVEVLMKDLAAADTNQGKLSSQCVGNIVSTHAQEIATTSQQYAELQQQILDEVLGENTSSQTKLLETLEEQLTHLRQQLTSATAEKETKVEQLKEKQQQLESISQAAIKLQDNMKKLADLDTKENEQLLQELSQYVEKSEGVKGKENEFKTACRNEAEQLRLQISSLQIKSNEAVDDAGLLEKYQKDKEKLSQMKLILAKKIRQIAALRRHIDDVPSRAELSQYQRRFVELYNQMASTDRETRQFYALYNTLEDTRSHMQKELTLLNSVQDNLAMALDSSASMEEFLGQLGIITEGIQQSKQKVEKLCTEECHLKSKYSEMLAGLQQVGRRYADTVHLLAQEIRRNEVLCERMATTY